MVETRHSTSMPFCCPAMRGVGLALYVLVTCHKRSKDDRFCCDAAKEYWTQVATYRVHGNECPREINRQIRQVHWPSNESWKFREDL